jgi:hypothetical protein
MRTVKRPGAEQRFFDVSLPPQRFSHPILIEELSTTPTFAGNITPIMGDNGS